MSLRVLIFLSVFFMTFTSGAQTPRKVAEIYETEVLALSSNPAQPDPVLIPARLEVRPADINGGVTSITLELTGPTTATLVRLTKFSLPPEYADVLDGQDDLILDLSGYTGYSGIGGIGGKRYDITALAKARGGSGATYNVLVTNAVGQPASGVKMDIQAGMGNTAIALGSETVPADGRIRLHVPQPPSQANSPGPGYFVYRPYSTLQITATDVTGQRERLSFPGFAKMGVPADTDHIHLAFLPRDTTATAFRGKLTGPDGRPAQDAQFTYHWLAFPGFGGVQFQGPVISISPAPDGTFCAGIPQDFLMEHLGVADLPPSSTLTVNVKDGRQLKLSTDNENLIQLPETEQVQLQLLDDHGVPVAGLEQNNLHTAALTSSDPAQEPNEYINLRGRLTDSTAGILTFNNVPVPANYSFEINQVKYQPVMLAKGAGAGVIQLHPLVNHAEVRGRVLAAENGQPVAGAYVLSGWDSNALNVTASLSPEMLESIWAAWDPSALTANEPKKNITVDKSKTIFSVDVMTKTDGQGQFTVVYEQGRTPKTVHVYIPGRMGATARVIDLKKPEGADAVYKLPDVALPLAASVTVPIIPPDQVPDKFLTGNGVAGTSLKDRFMVSVGFGRNGSWNPGVPPENSTSKNPWSLLTNTDWVSPGSRAVLAVPAEVKIQVSVSAPYEPTVGSAAWTDVGPLKPGENQVLPGKKVSVEIPFLISVKKKDNTPAVGVSVRIDGQLPLTTDKEGKVIGWTSGHVGRIEVMPENTWTAAAEKKDITVTAGENLTQVDMIIP